MSWYDMQYKENKKEQILWPHHPNILWVTKRSSNMDQRCVRLRDSIKFSLYWIALVAASLIVFMIAASHMQVKPLQFQAPTGSLDDVFVPDVVFFRLPDAIVTNANNSIGQSDSGSGLRGSNIENDRYELVSWTIILLVKLFVKSVNSYRHLHTKVSCEEILALSHLKLMDLLHVAHSWIRAVHHGLYSQWINQPFAWIALNIVWVSIKHMLPSEQSQNSSHQKSYLKLKPWHTSHHSRTTLSTCKPGWISSKHPKQLRFNPIRYIAPFAFYTRNVGTGEVAAVKIPKAFGIAVWVIFGFGELL